MQLLTTPEAAIYLDRGISTLQRWRQCLARVGPPFVRGFHGKALYAEADLDAWKAAIEEGMTLTEATEICQFIADSRKPMFADDQRVRWTRADGVTMIGPFGILRQEAEATGVVVPEFNFVPEMSGAL